MRYAMLICGAESNWDAGEERVAEVMAEIGAWSAKWEAAGKMPGVGAELEPVRTAKTVSRGADGLPVVTDGPYLELKEVVGGFILFDADDLDEAIAIASGWPGITAFGDKIEVRPTTGR
ncbi:YciI family protein [Catenuloplanes atrovinosus]|uniref:YCII-related domain-containing protein n=1 Tax=Catenuloplanes atrovinosus TaxID=137266 RepID=A0AAE3YN49_9ACTN|nr:YciI family protein [Catenuloplanes atrovinosus]MDR7276560.1 hypothetical protein [Catenuloplanes atrovinosus]